MSKPVVGIRDQLLRIKELSDRLNVMADQAGEAIKRVEALFFDEYHLTMRIEIPGLVYYQGRIYAVGTDGSETYWCNCKRDAKLEVATKLPALLTEAVALSERTITAAETAISAADSMLSAADLRPIHVAQDSAQK